MRARLPVGLAVAALVAAGCSGIPHSSRPSTVETIGLEPAPGIQVAGPAKGDDPRTVVLGFLDASGTPDPPRDGAYQFFTQQAKNHWDAGTVTVVGNPQVGVFDPTKDVVTLTGTVIGTIDRTGVYTPGLTGDGSGVGGAAFNESFGMKQVGGEWRIDTLANGLALTTTQFADYRQHTVYFFDVAEKHLVPDPRWAPPIDRAALEQFLIGQLALGPRDNLQSAETTELPPQTDPSHVVVSTVDGGPNGPLTKIEIIGASSLGAANLNRLSAQVAQTLQPLVPVGQLEITDGGVPVPIPLAGGATFTATQVTSPFATPSTPAGLYYISRGGVRFESGAVLPGKIGSGAYGLDSVALAIRANTANLLVAGTRADHSLLDIGSLDHGGKMSPVNKLPAGPLSRPEWAPGLTEVWIGDGNSLYRVLPNGTATIVRVTAPNGPAVGRVSAVRLSPEGARVALVLTNGDGSSQIWVGAVVRGSGPVRVDGLTAISPVGVDISDVAWNSELKLFAVGRDTADNTRGVYEVQVDGSLWTADGIANLPAPPTSITVSQGLVAAVAAGGTIWIQPAVSWVNVPGTESGGSAPVYSN